MANSTAYLNLSLLSTGESVGTWGIPLNNNFERIDTLGGEIENGRGDTSNINARFTRGEAEIEASRGTKADLASRLAVLLAADGSINITAVPTANQTQLGVVRLSTNPLVAGTPIAIGDNDPRIFSAQEKAELTTGILTHLHSHQLVDVIDVSVTPSELNGALSGAGSSVIAANLTSITDGSKVPIGIHTHPESGYNSIGMTELSVTPDIIAKPVAVGINDTKMLTQVQKDALTTGNDCIIHSHKLANGATDVITSVTVINQLSGASSTVTASNLDALTGGATTELHDHNNDYYSKTESDSNIVAVRDYVDAESVAHELDDTAHAGGNLDLGDITSRSLLIDDNGTSITVRAKPGEVAGTNKIAMKDSSGVPRFTVDESGNVACHDLVVSGTQTVVETTTLSQDTVATTDLTVNGNTTLGNNALVDLLTVNCLTSVFQNDVVIGGGLILDGTINGFDLSVFRTNTNTVLQEVVSARDGEANLLAKINSMDSISLSSTNEITTARDGEASLSAKMDIMEGLTSSVTSEVTAARGAETNLAAKVSTMDTLGALTAAEVTTARDGEASLLSKIQSIDASNNNVASEVTGARGGELTLDARLDAITNTSTTHNGRSDNPHNVTITQAISADGGTSATVLQLEALTDGSDADSLHSHVATETELTNARMSSVYGGFTAIGLRANASETILNGHDTEIINARSGEASLDAKLTAMSSTTASIEAEILAARSGSANLAAAMVIDEAERTATLLQLTQAKGSSTTLLERLDDHETEYTALKVEIDASTSGHASLNAKLNSISADAASNTASLTAAKGGFADVDARFTAAESSLSGLETEVQDARGATFATVELRLDASDSSLAAAELSLLNAKGSAASVAQRLSDIETEASLSHSPTITEAIANDGGTDVTVAELEILTGGSNADSLHSHAGIQADLDDAKISAALNLTFTSIDERLEHDEAILNNHSTEILNARGGQTTIDARLDINDTALGNTTGEIVSARGGQATLDSRISLLPQKYMQTVAAAATTWTITHGLSSLGVMVAAYDGSDVQIPESDITSITVLSSNSVEIVFGTAKAGRVVIIG